MRAILLALLFCAITQGAVLMKNGEVMAEIIVSPRANILERYAADELAWHLQKITGKEFPIVNEATGTLTPIRIGRMSPLPRDGWKNKNDGTLRITEDAIDLAGFDENGPVGHIAYSSGSARAVYSLLEEELGVRWLWPGETGVYAPKRTDIELEPTERAVGTRYKWNWWWVHPSAYSARWNDSKNFDRYQAEVMVWMRRHSFTTGWGSLGSYGHSYEGVYEQFSQTKPELFNLLPDVRRVPSPLYLNGNPRYVSMCVSNPEVDQLVLDRWEPPRFLNVAENDVCGMCTCPNCLVADGNDAPDRLERAQKAFLAGDKGWYKELGSVTNRYARFLQRLIIKSKEKAPEGTFILFGAYANYWKAPSPDIKLDKSIIVTFTPPFAYPIHKEQIEECKRAWKGWKDSGVELILRPNTMHDGHNFPLVYYPEMLELLDYADEQGLFGNSWDSFTGALAGNALTLFMLAERAGHGHERPVSDLEDDFFRAFGPAAEQIRAYWGVLRQATLDGYPNFGPSDNFVGNDFYGWFYTVAKNVFSDEIFAQAAKHLDEAKTVAKDDADALAKIEFLELGLNDARMTLAAQLGYEKYQKTNDAKEFIQAVQKLDAFRNENESKIYLNIGRMRDREDANWPRYLAEVIPNAKKLELEICFDSSETMPVDGKWLSASPENHWERIPAGLEWEKEYGKPYKGAAWYRARFTLTDVEAREHYRLNFGAVDGSGLYYLNGQKIHERPYPYKGDKDSWSYPFEVIVPTGVLHEGENELAVRVEKHIGLSGIWRPVNLGRMESLVCFILKDAGTVIDPEGYVGVNGIKTAGSQNLMEGKPWYPHPRSPEGSVEIGKSRATCQPTLDTVVGLYIPVDVNDTQCRPIVFAIESRATDANCQHVGRNYVVALDVIYNDGTVKLGVTAPFGNGTFDWKKSGGVFLPEKPVKRINFYAVSSKMTGEIQFRKPEIYLNAPLP